MENNFLELEEKIVAALRTIFDPEIPVNIYDLGLIYEVDVEDSSEEQKKVEITMTLTAPNCPAADFIVDEVTQKTQSLKGVAEVKVNLVFEPSWDKDMMTEEAKLELGML